MKHLLPPTHLLIREFFHILPYPTALTTINTIFTKAAANKAWRPANPYNAVHYCRLLQQLSKAAFKINDCCGGNELLKNYCSLLTKKQWKRFYEHLLLCTLSSHALEQEEEGVATSTILEQVTALVEACHSIYLQRDVCTL